MASLHPLTILPEIRIVLFGFVTGKGPVEEGGAETAEESTTGARVGLRTAMQFILPQSRTLANLVDQLLLFSYCFVGTLTLTKIVCAVTASRVHHRVEGSVLLHIFQKKQGFLTRCNRRSIDTEDNVDLCPCESELPEIFDFYSILKKCELHRDLT